MDISQLTDEKNKLFQRASELAEKKSYTAEEEAELPKLRERLVEVKGQIAKAGELANTRAALLAEIEDTKSFDAKVLPGSRPGFIKEVKGGHTPQPKMMGFKAPGVLTRHYLPEVELHEDDYKVLKKDGYSDNTIQNCSTRGYIDEFHAFLKSGGKIMSDLVLKSMTEAGAGGVLVPIQWGELITNPPMMGMLRGAVRNMAVNTLLMRYPRIQTTNVNYPAYPVTVTWGGEQPNSQQNPDVSNNFNTTNVDIQVNEVYAQGLFSISLLEDNAYSLQSYIPTVFQESLDVDLDLRIIQGTGTGVPTAPQPWGLNEANVIPLTTAVTTGATAKVTYQDLVNVMYQLPQQYRSQSVWLLNSQTLGAIASLVDNNGRPLFLPNFGYIGDTPGGGASWQTGTILGRPFIISENMPNIGQGNVSMYLADFPKLYFLLTRVGPTVKILDQPQYTAGNYIFALRARYGGRVVQPWAGRGLKHT